MYIESGKVKFYPSAYRQYQDGTETKNINPESELNTEYNITSHIAKLLKKNKGSFIVDYVENIKLEFYLGGYYTHITSPQDILGAFSNSTEIWANMKVTPFTPTDNTKGFSELYEVVDYDDIGKNIDEINNNILLFKGVAFLDEEDEDATFSLQLFAREDIESPWEVYEPSNYILDSSEIGNYLTPYNIDQHFNTDDLFAKQGHIDDATINTSLTVKGTTKLIGQIDFTGKLVPTNNNNIDIGANGKEFASIYVNKIIGVSEIGNGQNNITLMSSVVPSGTVNIGSTTSKLATIYTTNLNVNEITLNSNITPNGTVSLGLANKPVTNLYATNIYGTALKEVNEIDGGQSSITLKSDVFPDGTVDLGNTTNPFNTLYVNTINRYVGNITLGKTITPSTTMVDLGSSSNKFNNSYVGTSYVSTLNSTDNEIKVAKDIVPASYTILNLGSSTNQLFGVYAQNFYGNASTATKLNGTDAGGTKNPVYFDNGIPTASSYNSTLYDRIERESTFQNVVTSNPNARIFNVYIPSATTDNKVYMNMFALININGDKCSFNFVANSPSTSSLNNYSNHIRAYDVIYRLYINGPYSSGTSVRYSMTLQYNTNTSAGDSDSGWTTVSGEVVQSIVIHYTVR